MIRPDMLWAWVRDQETQQCRVLQGDEFQGAQHEMIAWQIVEVDEGGVAQHDLAKQASTSTTHRQWAERVCSTLGVGGQIVRVGLAAHGVHKGAPVEDVCFRRTDKLDGRYYQVCNPKRFNEKVTDVLAKLESFRPNVENGIVTMLHESSV